MWSTTTRLGSGAAKPVTFFEAYKGSQNVDTVLSEQQQQQQQSLIIESAISRAQAEFGGSPGPAAARQKRAGPAPEGGRG